MAAHTPAPVPDPSTLTPSLIRTLFPMVAGAIANWLLEKLGLYELDSVIAAGFVSAGLGWIYYAIARFLEVYGSDRWGYILGFRRTPVYPAGTTPAAGPADPVAPPAERNEGGFVDGPTLAMGLIAAGLVGLVISLLVGVPWLVTVAAIALCAGVILYVVAASGWAASRRR